MQHVGHQRLVALITDQALNTSELFIRWNLLLLRVLFHIFPMNRQLHTIL